MKWNFKNISLEEMKFKIRLSSYGPHGVVSCICRKNSFKETHGDSKTHNDLSTSYIKYKMNLE